MTALFDSLQMPVYVLEKGSRIILFANNYLKELLGENPEGRCCWAVFKGRESPCSEGCLCDIDDYSNGLRTKEYYSKELNRWFHCTLNQIRWLGGEPEFLFINMDITRQKQREEKLAVLAGIDSLTGIYNRRSGVLILDVVLASCMQQKGTMVFCYFDIDNLKSINDAYGHAEGDKVIKLFASIVQAVKRKKDVLIRMGGDEFILGLPYCDLKDAQRIIDIINNEIDKASSLGEIPYKISFSYGLEEAVFNLESSIDEMIHRADKKMYQHKIGKTKRIKRKKVMIE